MHMTGHHDDGHARSAVVSSNAPTDLVAFDVGKNIINQHQIGILANGMIPHFHDIGGFLAIEMQNPAVVQETLRKQEVWTDYRGNTLRLGPAPYLSDDQINEAVEALRDERRKTSAVMQRTPQPRPHP